MSKKKLIVIIFVILAIVATVIGIKLNIDTQDALLEKDALIAE